MARLPGGRGYRSGPDRTVNQQESEYLRRKINELASASGTHARLHNITSTDDHTSAATPGKLLKADGNGLPVDAASTDVAVASAVAASHTKQHDLGSTADHASGITPGALIGADINGLPCESLCMDLDVANAVSASHLRKHAITSTDDHTGIPGPLIPVGGIIFANIAAASLGTYFDATGLGKAGQSWESWAVCNGNNGTPSLTDKFLRMKATGAGGTGGNDSSAHNHAIDHDHGSFTSGSHTLTTAEIPAHGHSITGGASNLPVAVDVAGSDDPVAYSFVDGLHASSGGSAGYFKANNNTGGGGGHTHSVDPPALTGTSGAASATDNKPAYYELLPVMRVA